MRCVGRCCAILALGLMANAQQRVPPPQQQAAEEVKPEDYAKVRGAVFDAHTEAPLSKATIMMTGTGSASRTRLSTKTGSDGTFTFDQVAPGQWHLSASRNFYARQSYGQKGNNSRGAALSVAPGQEISDITFRLVPAAVITGRVVDEDADPVPYCQVMAMRFVYGAGKRQLLPVGGTSQTDDRGEYRLFGIPPGKYYVGATYRSRGAFGASQVGTSEEIDSSYPTVYYPGVLDPQQTTPVQIRGGEERSGIDFRLIREQAFRVAGKITMPGGGPLPSGSLLKPPPNRAVGNPLTFAESVR